ncbi:uncharacterized protein LOC114916096 isoform X2 [Cajanus cajan]|uniref:uncharacterized protein LOC114916096 isoform X2 n=1 Tax=Cajanus cajan TaxID=3821 RepID=UPI0010FAD2CD|nr:uncharacterized protein LOC114916096 isoform X2 [Cajanus cajan]
MAPEFKTKSIQAQKNRASEKGGSLHTGGSITPHEHAIRMSQELGRLPHVDELFHQTHVRKVTGDFVDQRSKRTYARSEAASCTGGSETSPMDPVEEERLRNKSWIVAAGGITDKRRLYGVGKVTSPLTDVDTLINISSGRATEELEKIIQLEEQVRKSREEARQSREQNERLQRQFQSLFNAVLPLLPSDTQHILQQQVDQQCHDNHDDQQPPPTGHYGDDY